MMTTDQSSMGELLGPPASRTEADFELWLAGPDAPAELAEAMRYCVLGGGKRLRPGLVQLAAEAVGGEVDEVTRRAAVAVEMIHSYSLVHDDLPAMDDDTLRRGQPTAHVKFGQAMAILAGDALLTRAFEVLCETDDDRSARLVCELAAGAGPAGMVAGQVADMGLCELPDGLEGLQYIHRRKTGALIRAAVRMGAIAGRADDDQLRALAAYAESLGLVFQMVDDLLDVVSDAATLGKTPGKDAETGKRTYVSELGLDEARQRVREETARALDALSPLGERAQRLQRLAELLTERTH